MRTSWDEDSGAPDYPCSRRESLGKLTKWKAAFRIHSSPRKPIVSQPWALILALRNPSQHTYVLIYFPFVISFSLWIQLFLLYLIRKSILSSDLYFYSANRGWNWLFNNVVWIDRRKHSCSLARKDLIRWSHVMMHCLVELRGQKEEQGNSFILYLFYMHACYSGGPV